MTNQSWASDDFKPTESSKGNYTKLKEWDTKLRILTSPIKGWEYFNKENKPVRSETEIKDPTDIKEKWQVKQFWAMWVYNYDEKKLQVWEITQNSLKKQLRDLTGDEDFGSPTQYDIKVNRSWKDLETTYMIKALSKNEFKEKDILKDSKQLNLRLLYTGWNPFEEIWTIKAIEGWDE